MVSSSSVSPERLTAPTVPAFGLPPRLAGILLAFVSLVALGALATWSANDPSFSLATEKPPANLFGFAGAAFADFAFQFFGIAAFVSVLPPAIWSLFLVQRLKPARLGPRVALWPVSLLLASGLLSCFAAPAAWPLPTGLGGLAGFGFSSLAALIAGETPTGAAAILYGLILLPPALFALWFSTGIAGAKVAVAPEDPDVADRNGPFDVIIGGIVHAAFTMRTAWRRALAREKRHASPAPHAGDRRGAAHDAEMAHGDRFAVADDRIEPRFDAGYEAASEPFEDDSDLDYMDVEPDSSLAGHNAVGAGQNRHPDGERGSAPHIAAAARPQPGRRAAMEAQGSLLETDGFELPELSLLAEPQHGGLSDEHQPERLEAQARQLEGVLEDFGVKGDIIHVRPGPVVTLYELEPAPGIKSSRVISLADDIARSMSAISARVAVVPGRNVIGIELPNQTRETVYLKEMLSSADFEKSKGKLNICLGKTIGGEPVVADLARMPHLLVAGTTGSGKSVAINTMVLSILYKLTPEQCRLIMIDPKMLELSVYDGIPHLLSPVVTDPGKAVIALKWAVREMEDRYKKMSKIGVRNIDGFNARVAEARKKGKTITRTVQTGFDKQTGEALYEHEEFDLEPLPFIVVIVDEMADLMMVAGKDIEGAIQRLAQMARAAGIHLITATQRPSVDVITGTIKANFPTRISFQVTSKIDSRTILGEQGAEQLLGMGDMLYMAGGGRIRRLHGPFVSDREVEDVVAHLKSQGSPDYLDSVTSEDDEDEAGLFGDGFGGSGDELYDKAVNIVLSDKKASTSYIQRRLSVGYNRAATLIERMEKEGVISPANHAGKREILVGDNADGY
ncbi:MAG: DNA translocase FtsK 4TM domain-containing protein [Alphaproteobacteria bacterium]|nr:DNA translocase FtsK 4TM domain-containing protein [Alphaproteobacteria bacterium]